MKELKKISEDIRKGYEEEPEESNAWFFWSKNKAEKKGFHNADFYTPIRFRPNRLECPRTMFVAPNPSTGRYDDSNEKYGLRRFLDKLSKLGFAKRIDRIINNTYIYYEGCFVTDLIKVRLRRKDAKRELQRFEGSKWEYYFNREIKVVDPLLLVALGDDAYKTLRKMKIRDRPIEKVYHYGSFRFPRFEEAFDQQIDRVKQVYNFLASYVSQ